MRNKTILLIIFMSLGVGEIAAKTPLNFSAPGTRNWSQRQDTIYLTLDKADLDAKRKGATKLYVVLSARYLAQKFWRFYPAFTEKCVINKAYDFKWIESIAVDPAKVTSHQFKITGAKGAYYGFVLVQGPGGLKVIKAKKIAAARKYAKSELLPNAVVVANPAPLKRKWEDKNKKLCK